MRITKYKMAIQKRDIIQFDPEWEYNPCGHTKKPIHKNEAGDIAQYDDPPIYISTVRNFIMGSKKIKPWITY